jgi:putative hemolysin
MIIIIFLLLFLMSGIFSMFEVALVSSRKHRLQDLADRGSRGAKTAILMLKEPEKMLSIVQSGITLVSIISGAYGGITLTDSLAQAILQLGISGHYAHFVSVILVVGAITYLTLIFAELLPKTIALSNPEKIAVRLSPFMKFIGILIYPLVFILTISIKLLVRLLGLKYHAGPPVTEEELKILIKQGSDHGVIEKEESEMIREVFRFGDKTTYNLMTPSADIVFIDKNDPEEVIMELILSSNFSRFPVCDDTIDHVIGIVTVRDILRSYKENRQFNLTEIVSPPLYIPEVMPALNVLELFREKKVHIGIVVNEFGTTEGLITLHDISESILGDFPALLENEPPEIFRREDGSLLVDGTIQLNDLKDELKIYEFPVSSESENISTLGGLAMILLNKVPEVGDSFLLSGYRFEIVDMDGQRVDKVLVSKIS